MENMGGLRGQGAVADPDLVYPDVPAVDGTGSEVAG